MVHIEVNNRKRVRSRSARLKKLWWTLKRDVSQAEIESYHRGQRLFTFEMK